MLSRQVEEIGRDFFLRRLRAAEEHRRARGPRIPMPTAWCTAKRDLLPALVVDRYGDYLVVQTLDQGMDAAKADDRSLPEEIFQPKGIVARNDVAVRAKEDLPLEADDARGRGPRVGAGADERPHPARRPAARPEDRHLPRPARELPRRRPLRPRRRGARLLHLHRRLRAAPGGATAKRVEAVDSSGAGARDGARQRRRPTASPTSTSAKRTSSIC